MMYGLQNAGITESTIYPDLEGLSRELLYYYVSDPTLGGQGGVRRAKRILASAANVSR